jgi:hypothetical protein
VVHGAQKWRSPEVLHGALSTQGTGARLGEIAPLSAADVKTDELTNIHSIVITEDLEQGRRLKTSGSRRVVPVHPELIRIGFIELSSA